MRSNDGEGEGRKEEGMRKNWRKRKASVTLSGKRRNEEERPWNVKGEEKQTGGGR